MYGSQLSEFDKRVIKALSFRAGIAAAALSAWAKAPQGSIQTARSLVDLSGLGLTEEISASQVLAQASQVGLIEPVSSGFVPKIGMHASFDRLSAALFAIDFYVTRVHSDASTAGVVLTKPPMPSELEKKLSDLGWKTSDLEPTEESFRRMVGTAVERVVVMSPFLDVRGGEWLRNVLSSARTGVKRVLILRSLEDPTRGDYPVGFTLLGEWLSKEGVDVYNYSIPRIGSSGRETFHAKVVLCDRATAYVGSSNLTSASLSHSMEIGIAVSGRAAGQVAIVVDAVLNAAQKVI